MSRPYLTVDQVVIGDETPYIHASEYQSWGPGCCFLNESHYFTSQDYGKTWEEVAKPSTAVLPVIEQPGEAQVTKCVPNNQEICYRLIGKDYIEISTDGGKTWQIDWQMPFGRKKYMERNPEIASFVRVTPDTIPFDLGIISKDNQHTVIVAMGNQGLLVKSTKGIWERYRIPSTSGYRMLGVPLPFYASSFKEATQVLGTETTRIVLGMLSFFILLSILTWRNINKQISEFDRAKTRWSYIPFVLSVVGFVILIFLVFANLFLIPLQDSRFADFLYSVFLEPSVSVCLIPIAGLLVSWLVFILLFPHHKIGLLAALGALIYSILFGIGTYLPFILWTFGVIPLYEIALVISLVLGVLAIIFGFRYEKRLIRQTTY